MGAGKGLYLRYERHKNILIQEPTFGGGKCVCMYLNGKSNREMRNGNGFIL